MKNKKVYSQECFLFLFEPSSIEDFLKNSSTVTYSHDLNLLQLAQAALDLGIRVIASSYGYKEQTFVFEKYWPKIVISNVKPQNIIDPNSVTFTFCSNHLGFAERNRKRNRNRNRNRNVLVQAAVHIIEQPRLFYPHGTASYINAYRNSIDFVITQNARMKELLTAILGFVAGFRDPDRILISKLSPRLVPIENFEKRRKETRRELGVSDLDIVILNAGGAWKWTKFNEFLLAFESASKSDKKTKLFFIQPALAQPANTEHRTYHRETESILKKLKPDIRNRIYIGESWAESALRMEDFLCAADYGLNLNEDSLEQWQSYRVRILEYLSANLPTIMSRGSFWDIDPAHAAFVFTDHSKAEFVETLIDLMKNHRDLAKVKEQKAAILELKNRLSLENQSKRVIVELLNHPRRKENPLVSRAVLWDFQNAGPVSGTSINRFAIKLYYVVVARPILHFILVIIGARKLLRTFTDWPR